MCVEGEKRKKRVSVKSGCKGKSVHNKTNMNTFFLRNLRVETYNPSRISQGAERREGCETSKQTDRRN